MVDFRDGRVVVAFKVLDERGAETDEVVEYELEDFVAACHEKVSGAAAAGASAQVHVSKAPQPTGQSACSSQVNVDLTTRESGYYVRYRAKRSHGEPTCLNFPALTYSAAVGLAMVLRKALVSMDFDVIKEG
jgi:hypothetical protein